MGYTIAQKIIKAHLLSGETTVGSDIGLKIDQTLTQDATGTMASSQNLRQWAFRACKAAKSVAYIRPQHACSPGFENADDHRFHSGSVTKRTRHILFACPGNGICHQVHLETIRHPGKDSSSAQTATHRPAAASVCWRSAREDSTSRSQWAAALTSYITYPEIIGMH